MSCPGTTITGCDFAQFLVDQTPVFDEMIMRDIRPTDGWVLNVATGGLPMGTPTEVTQDRFRAVFPNTTKKWERSPTSGPGCAGNPCDPTEHQIGWGADRLTWYEEVQSWATPLMCFDQQMHVTHAESHLDQIINDILRPATIAVSSNFLRRRAILWANHRWTANSSMDEFTYVWSLTGANLDDEAFFDCSVPPTNVFKLVPQHLQARFEDLMLIGYAGKNPYADTSPFVELVSDMDTIWSLEHLGGQQGVGGASSPNVLGNWRFQSFTDSSKYWRYGYSGSIGNFMARNDPMGLRFNFVADLGAAAGANRFRYQVVLPYKNVVTTGAGGAAGLGSIPNPDFKKAQFRISYIWHKKAIKLLTIEAHSPNAEMPYASRDFAGKWQFVMDNLGADANGVAINNKRRNKGQFIADFRYYVQPLNTEFAEVFFHKGEQMCIPNIGTCNASPGYPAQSYTSRLPTCPLPSAFSALYGTGAPSGNQDGPVPPEVSPP